MNNNSILKIVIAIAVVTVIAVVGWFWRGEKGELLLKNSGADPKVKQQIKSGGNYRQIEFAKFNPAFRFAGEVSAGYDVEFIPQSEAVNIFDPNFNNGVTSNFEKSQIFIKYFKADKFLTLSTVDIIEKQPDNINGHPAVRYEIIKKPQAINFPNQPLWRSSQHDLVDIRLNKEGQTFFYVFTRNPSFPKDDFEKFINSLKFHNDRGSFVYPVTQPEKRISKKPFGIKVSPGNSPIKPERFSGYHAGTDFEILPGEELKDVEIYAVCGGELLTMQTADGYGGLATQLCQLDDEQITIVYGHIDTKSAVIKIGQYIYPGQKIALLGDEGPETDGARKHLHLGILRDRNDIRGYVQDAGELSKWHNPQEILKLQK